MHQRSQMMTKYRSKLRRPSQSLRKLSAQTAQGRAQSATLYTDCGTAQHRGGHPSSAVCRPLRPGLQTNAAGGVPTVWAEAWRGRQHAASRMAVGPNASFELGTTRDALRPAHGPARPAPRPTPQRTRGSRRVTAPSTLPAVRKPIENYGMVPFQATPRW